MKKLILATIVSTLSFTAHANGNGNADNTNTNDNTNNSSANATSNTAIDNNNSTRSDADAYSGGNTWVNQDFSTSSYTDADRFNYNVYERARFQSMRFGKNCVGTVCESTPNFYIQGQIDSIDSPIQIGVAIPFTLGYNPTRSAMKTEAQYLIDRNLYERERHQADMAEICINLHTFVQRVDPAVAQAFVAHSTELWNRCAGFTHGASANIKPHNQHGNPNQISSHVRR